MNKEREYFYRVLGSEVFEKCREEKAPVPVRLKSDSQGENSYFSFESGKWLPFKYENFDSTDFQFFAEYTKEAKDDKNGISMDVTGASVITDEEKMTLEFSVQYLSRSKSVPSPAILEESVLFDMKKGTVFHSANPQKQNSTEFSILPPKKAVDAAFNKLTALAEKFTSRKFSSISSILSAPSASSSKPQIDEKKQILSTLSAMKDITVIPFAPELNSVISSKELKKMNMQFKFTRDDSDVLKKFFRKMKIENCKMTQNAYLKNPMLLVTYIKMKKCGFKDANLFEAVLLDDENAGIFDSLEISSLKPFSKFCMKKCGEAAAMSLILKKSDSIENKSNGISTFTKNFRHIPKELVKDILENGFTDENCTALSAIR